MCAVLRDVPDVCPSCGSRLHHGLSYRHSIGPGRAARWASYVSVPIALGATCYVFLDGARAFRGFGQASAPLIGCMLWVGIDQIARLLPRTRRVRCKQCSWQREVAYGERRARR